MAMKTKIGQLDGSLDGVQLTVMAWDDTGSSVGEASALTAAEATRPTSLFGTLLPTGTTSVSQKSRHIYEFKFTYEPPQENQPDQPEPPETGSLVRRGNLSTKSITLTRYIAPVGVFNEDADVSEYYAGQKWSPKQSGPESDQGQHGDVTVEPLGESRTLDYYIPNIDLTEEYVDGIEELVEAGAFNSDEFFGFPTATIQIVRYSLQERSTNDWELSLGFGRRPVKTDVSVSDDIVIPTLRACDHYYVIERPYYSTGGELITSKAKLAVVGQAWPLMDFSTLDLPGQEL